MSVDESAELKRQIETLRSQIEALQALVACLEPQIEALEITTAGHSRSLDHAIEMREIAGRTMDRVLGMVAGHSERIQAIEAHLWPGIAHDHKALRKIIGPRGEPGAGEELDKRK